MTVPAAERPDVAPLTPSSDTGPETGPDTGPDATMPDAPLCSPWGEDPGDHPLPDHPRPMLERTRWASLNGWWEYAVTTATGARDAPLDDEPVPAHWDGSIRVPFALESAASGVTRPLAPEEVLHYRRRILLPEEWQGGRIALNFEAVDFRCLVRVDGRIVGHHEGGYLPFTVELPDTHRPEVEVVVTVRDPTDDGLQQHGKQSLTPGTIWYTATSGIWQSVWMEPLPPRALTRVEARPRPDLSGFDVLVEAEEPCAVHVEVSLGEAGRVVASGHSSAPIPVDLPDPHPWSPEDPYLYPLAVTTDVDRVSSWAALRTVTLGTTPTPRADTTHDEGGGRHVPRPLLRLNGSPLLLNTPLWQGYWPESGLTAPAEAALVHDLTTLKDMGFNGVRVHVKTESRRFYHLADRLGMMVVQDMPSGGKAPLGLRSSGWVQALNVTLPDRSTIFRRRTGRRDAGNRRSFARELAAMVRLLGVHGCVVMWVPFNEGWGQFDALGAQSLIHRVDPTRPVDHASGWFDQGGDLYSRHRYVLALRPPRRHEHRPFSLSEFGGLNLAVAGHRWESGLPFGYRFLDDEAALARALEDLWRNQLIPLLDSGLTACTYTQVSDVEGEDNGLMTYDRRVTKVDTALMARLNAELQDAFHRLHPLSPR